MDISNYLIGLVLAFARIGTFVFTLPFFRGSYIVSSSKIVISIALSFAVIGQFKEIAIHTLTEFIGAIAIQTITGLVLAFLVTMLLESVRTAGSLIDLDLGFSNATMFDHSTNQNTTVIANILFYIFMFLFLAFGGFTNLIAGIIYSFEFATPSYFLGNQNTMEIILDTFLYMLTAAIQIALPMMISSFIVNIILLILGSTAKEMNIFLNMYAIKIAIGMLILILLLPYMINIFEQMNYVILERFMNAIHILLSD